MLRTSEFVLLQQLCLARKRVNRAIANLGKELSQLSPPILDSKTLDFCTQYTVVQCITFLFQFFKTICLVVSFSTGFLLAYHHRFFLISMELHFWLSSHYWGNGQSTSP